MIFIVLLHFANLANFVNPKCFCANLLIKRLEEDNLAGILSKGWKAGVGVYNPDSIATSMFGWENKYKTPVSSIRHGKIQITRLWCRDEVRGLFNPGQLVSEQVKGRSNSVSIRYNFFCHCWSWNCQKVKRFSSRCLLSLLESNSGPMCTMVHEDPRCTKMLVTVLWCVFQWLPNDQ